MGNEFAPYSTNPNTFVVQNISNPPKVVRVFNFPIPYGTARDLMQIPGVAEDDIRASLLKGELNIKIKAKELTILDSDINLLQFNSTQYAFLSSAGVSTGIHITPAQASGLSTGGGSVTYTLKQGVVPVGSRNGTNRVFFTPDLFLDGAYNGNIFRLAVLFNGRQLVKGVDYEISKTGNSPGTGYNTITFISLTPPNNAQIYVDYAVAVTTPAT